MKEALNSWVQNLVFYTLLMEVVLHVLPERSPKKYLQFFMGVVLIILVISPLLNAAGLSETLDQAYVQQTYDQELQEFQKKQGELEEKEEALLEEKLQEAQEELAGAQEEELPEEDSAAEASEEETAEAKEGRSEISKIHIEIGDGGE